MEAEAMEAEVMETEVVEAEAVEAEVVEAEVMEAAGCTNGWRGVCSAPPARRRAATASR